MKIKIHMQLPLEGSEEKHQVESSQMQKRKPQEKMAKMEEDPRRIRLLENVGKTFGRLNVLSLEKGEKRSMFKCSCSCGKIKLVAPTSILNGRTRSCGCLHVQELRERCFIHGISDSPIHVCWMNMKQRCYNPKSTYYRHYGGRGITVCDRWMIGVDSKSGFQCFLEDMGPSYRLGLTIDRINPNENYSPENCRWITQAEQTRNRRNNIILEHDGRRMILSKWAMEIGVRPGLIGDRIRLGWSASNAITNRKKKNQFG